MMSSLNINHFKTCFVMFCNVLHCYDRLQIFFHVIWESIYNTVFLDFLPYCRHLKLKRIVFFCNSYTAHKIEVNNKMMKLKYD
jgi:hypothetical protein